MYMPLVSAAGGKTRRQVARFGGLHRAQDAREGELTDCVGLSSRDWPCLGQRPGRALVRRAPEADALCAWDKLVTVEGGRMYYGDRPVGELAPGGKQFAVVNTKLCVFPDKKYLDLETLELRELGARVDTVASSVLFGEDFAQLRAPHSILGSCRMRRTQADGYDWLDSFRFKVYAMEDLHWDAGTGWAQAPYVERRAWGLKKGDCLMLPLSGSREDREPDYEVPTHGGYAQEYDRWGDFLYLTADPVFEQTDSGPSYFEISMERRNAAGMNQSFLDRGLQVGDTVTISGCVTLAENNIHIKLLEIWEDKLVFDRPVLLSGQEAGAVTFERRIPDLDFICAAQGRLFGAGSADNTVYASALDDPTNFFVYEGLDTDGCALRAGGGGAFTGCAAYGGGALFFKEDCIYKLMGSRPAAYELYAYQAAGLQRGSEGSAVVIDDVLYYKGREGVYAYAGSTPKLISEALGNSRYEKAAAGTDGQRYYIAMEGSGGWELLVYDPRLGLWLKEDERPVSAFATLDGVLYMLSEGALYALGQGEDDQGAAIPWQATFAPFDEAVHRRKYPSRLLLRLELGEGAWVEAQLSRDGGPFRHVWTARTPGPTAAIPIRPGRCDRYQLRLRGEGRCLVRGLAREFSLGGVW